MSYKVNSLRICSDSALALNCHVTCLILAGLLLGLLFVPEDEVDIFFRNMNLLKKSGFISLSKNQVFLEKYDWMVWPGFVWIRMGTSGGPCDHGNEPSGSIKCWKLLEWLSDW
jgi:hypothetical protein